MQTVDLLDKREDRRHAVQIVPSASDREIVEIARRRLRVNPNEADALHALAAWYATVGEPDNAKRLLDRLVSRQPDYPGVWWLRARVLRDLGREQDGVACERIAQLYEDDDLPNPIRRLGEINLVG